MIRNQIRLSGISVAIIALFALLLLACTSDSANNASVISQREQDLENALAQERSQVSRLQEELSQKRICPACPPCPDCSEPNGEPVVNGLIDAEIAEVSALPERFRSKIIRVRGFLCMCSGGTYGFCHLSNDRRCIPGMGATLPLYRFEGTPDEAWMKLLTTKIAVMREPFLEVVGNFGGHGTIGIEGLGVLSVDRAKQGKRR
jgi:hypothetical protein